MRKKKNLEGEIKEEAELLEKARNNAIKERNRLAYELAKIKKEIKEAKVESNAIKSKEEKEEVKEESIPYMDAKNYQFTLTDCYIDDTYSIEFSYTLDDENIKNVISLTDPKTFKLMVSVDSKEIAEDLHDRNNWKVDWTTNSSSNSLEATFSDLSSKEKSLGFRKTVDCGFVEIGAMTDSLREFFLNGESLKGVFRTKKMEAVSDSIGSKWYASFQTYSRVSAPFVLSDESASWVPKENYSALPKGIKRRVPFRYRYWTSDDDEIREKIKNSLVQSIRNDIIYLPFGNEYNGRFELIKEWVPYKESQYHLLIEKDKIRRFSTPVSLTSGKIEQFVLRESSEFNLGDCKEKILELSEEPRYARTDDWGKCTIYEDLPDRMHIKFAGAKFGGIWELRRYKGDEWEAYLLEAARPYSFGLSSDQVDHIIDLTRKGTERPEIAQQVGCCYRTVYLYQKMLNLL